MPSPRSHYLSSVLHDLLADLARDELRAQERAAQLEAQLRLAQEATTCSSMHTIRRMQSSLARAVLHAYASVRPTEPSSMMAEPLMAEPLPHTASMEAFALWMQELLSDGVRMDVNQTPIELQRPTSASGSELQLSEQLGGALRAARLERAPSSTRSMSQKMVQYLLTGLAKTFVETYLRRIGGSPGDVDMLLATNEWQHLLAESSAAFVTRRARLELMDPGTHAVSIPILDPYFWVADDEDDPSSTADPSGQGNLLSRASVSSLWSAPEGAWRAEGSWADERPFGSPLHPRRPASAVVMSRTPTRVVSLADVWSTSSMPRIPKPRTLSTDVRDKCTPLLLSPYQTWRNARSPTLNKQPNKQRADKVHVLGQGQRDGSTVVADRLQRLQTGSKRISDGITQVLDGPILEQLALGCLEVATDKVTASMAEKQFIDGELTRTRDALPAESQESDQRVRQGVRVEDQAVNLMFSAGARVSQSRTPPPSPGEKQPISPFLKRASSVPLLVKAEQKGEKDKKLCHEHNVLSRTASTLSESIAATRAASRLAGGRPAAAMPPGGKDQGGSQSWQTLQGKPYDETRNGRRSLPGRRSPPPSETKPTQPKVLLEDYIAKRVALGLPEPMSTKSPKVLLEEYLAQKALKRASTMGVLMLMTTSPTVTELDSRLESNRAEGIDRVIVLVRLQTRLRGWCARHRRDKVTLLVARQEAAKRVLTSWAKRRYLRSSIWRLWHRQMAAAVETIMQRFTEAYDPTLSEDEVARKGLRRVDALAMLKKGLGRQHENAHAIADALEEYCKLGGVDAKVKRGAERFLNALGADLPENSHLPAMRRMYKKEQPHALRIFFSSTFRDMDGEREFFARRYAAELRTLARAQGVFVTFVDLGAGSTPHAESSQEEVVHIGFKQLKQSRYFVHFIGSRYGWRPSIEELKKDTVQEFDCLRTYIPGRSITEVEVVYGALGWGPQSACSPKNAFFYIRSNKFCNNIPLKAKDDYVDGDPCVQSRLADLKLRIRARAAESNKHHGKAISGASLPFVECCRDYERPEDFAKLLFDDLRAAILRDYPEKKIFSALDEQFMRHIQVASQHCDVYVGHESVQQQIDEYIASAGTTGPRTPLILAGIAGSGKSAALANWLFRTSIVGFVFPHFCSATETSNSHDGILPRLASELKRSFGFEHDLPADKDELIELIPKWVTLACTSTPVVVILDGIDQLAETEARALAWLPNALPRNFSLLLSTSNDPLVLKSCASRGWNNIITMPKLSVADQDKLTADLLAWHNTTLESHLLLMLTKTTKTTSPLFLRMAIELLVVNNVATENSTTDGFSLQSLLSSCLQRPSASELAKFVLLRLETRYGKQLIQSVFSYLEASRFGMSEVEMIELLKMNQADWCFLFTAIRTLLCESVGLLIISGRVMRQAVRKRYFLDEAYVVAIHRELIDFFRTLSSSTMSDSIRIRCCTELPFHMIHAHELDMLSDYLLDVGRVRHLLMDSSLSRELTSLWAQVGSDRMQQHGSQYVDSLAQCEKELRKEMATSFKMLGQSRKDIKHASLDLLARIAGHLGSFLCESYQYHCAAALHKRAIEIDRGLIDDFGERVPEGFRLLANTQSLMGAYVDAISNYFMAAGIYAHCAKTQPSARIEYAQTLFEIAGVARYVEEETVVTVSGENVFLKDKARRQCLSALRTFQDVLGDHSPRLAPVLVRLAYLFYGLGPEEQEQARQYAEDAKKLCKDAESSDRTDERFDSTMAEATHVLGAIHLKSGRLRQACDCLWEALNLSTLCEGSASLLTAEILEDLALAHIRMRFDVVQEPIPPLDDKADDERISSGWTWPEGTIGDMLFAVLIPATTVAGHVVEFLRNLRDPKGGTDDEEAIDAMLVCALEIRRRKNGRGHVHVAHCLIRRAELLWNQSKYAEIIELYTEASKIFEDAAGTPKCKPVAQLASWMTVAHMNNNNFKTAEEEHKRAEELASQVFGLGSVAEATKHISATAVIATSWESYRVMMDKVRIYTSMALHFKLQAGNTPSAAREAMLERFGKLKAKAERHEAQARIVRDTLLKEDFKDDVLPHLSHYAPIHRESAGTQARVQKRVVAKAASPPSGSGSRPKPSPASSPKSTRNTVTR